jgi:hypothetical protein
MTCHSPHFPVAMAGMYCLAHKGFYIFVTTAGTYSYSDALGLQRT